MATAKEYYQAQDAEFARQRAAKQAADDARIISYAENDPNKLGVVDRWFGGVERARERQALQAPPEPVRTGPPPEPPAGISQAGLPLDAIQTAGIRKSALDPQRIVANAAIDTDKAVASNLAAKQQAVADTRAANRAAIESVDVGDLDAMRDSLTKASRTGQLTPYMTSLIDKLKTDRLNTARQGMSVNDMARASERTAARQEQATKGVLASSAAAIANNNVDDATKAKLKHYSTLISDPMQMKRAMDMGIDPLYESTAILMGLTDDAIAAQAGGGTATVSGGPVNAGGEYFRRGFAEGGEVAMDMMELPGAIDEAPLDMNSGDYIIPVEAMRFYGRKFFQDLINKAEDVAE